MNGADNYVHFPRVPERPNPREEDRSNRSKLHCRLLGLLLLEINVRS
jgi:hypothetical protein